MTKEECTEVVLQARGAAKHYRTAAGEVRAVADADLSIAEGEFVAIMGPSGSGKTTLLSMLGALESPTKGAVLLRGRDLSRLRSRELASLRRFELGFIFQSFYLVDHLTAFENIRFPLGFNDQLKPAARDARAVELLEMVGLADRADHFPRQLSGGEQQRVAIARAMANEPAVILADEPTGNLDRHSGDEIMRALEDLNQSLRQTLVVVTHDENVARRARRLILLEDGSVVADREIGGQSTVER